MTERYHKAVFLHAWRDVAGMLKWLYMALERTALDALQRRVDEIRATGNDDLAARAWHALSGVIRRYLVEVSGRDPQHVTVTDARLFLRRNS
jgi:hypothetical protein